jgi:hypothetical protein
MVARWKTLEPMILASSEARWAAGRIAIIQNVAEAAIV